MFHFLRVLMRFVFGVRQRSRCSTHSACVKQLSTVLNSPSKTDIAMCNQLSSRQHISFFAGSKAIWFWCETEISLFNAQCMRKTTLNGSEFAVES